MKLVRYPSPSIENKPSVITIGNFDGLHLGHQKLISTAKRIAVERSWQLIVVTMYPFPEQYFGNQDCFFRINTLKQQYCLLQKMHVDCFCVLNFNERLANMHADDFIKKIIINALGGKHIVVGDDFRFGKDRKGDYSLLRSICDKLSVGYQRVGSFHINRKRVSSSLIRAYLTSGDLANVNQLLGRSYVIEGRVKHGKKIGRTLGFPTLNINISNSIGLRGVYVVSVRFLGVLYEAVANIGMNPTVVEGVGGKSGRAEVVLEVYVFGFNQMIYGQQIEVLFHKKIRNEVKFDGLDALKEKMRQDVKDAKLYFKSHTPY